VRFFCRPATGDLPLPLPARPKILKTDSMRSIHFFILLLSLVSCENRKPQALVIATAANVQFAMQELVATFQKETGILCETVLSSSGKLTAQIQEGAPFHVFVSADMTYPEELHKNGLTTGPPEVYAYGKLVLWTLRNDLDLTPEQLTQDDVRHIAIANPKTAPYGSAAVEALRHFGIFEKTEPKLVFGESISQTNQFIISKTADAGFTAKSVVLSPELKTKGRWTEVDETAYTPIAQGAVVIQRQGEVKSGALEFYRFLFSEKARQILQAYGYEVKH
jgi:molybdate transport system substrate-binding protein